MPGIKGKTSLFASQGKALANAHEGHKSAEPPSGNGRLPEGIEAGIAELRECKFGVYREGENKGKPYFFAVGIVQEPKVHNGIPIDGMRTQLGPMPLCETPKSKIKTFKERWERMQDQLKLLAGKEAIEEIDGTPEEIEAGYVDLMDTLVENKTMFRFRTWKGKATKDFPNPRVNEEWGGAVTYEGQASPETHVDETPADPDPESDGGSAGDEPPDAADAGADAGDEGIDIASLVDAANNKDKSAQVELKRLAMEAGASAEDVANADNWEAVGAMANSDAGVVGDEGSEAEGQEWKPAKGDTVKYNVSTTMKVKGKPVKRTKTIEAKVTSVDAKSDTATIKDNDDGKVYKDVPFAELEPAE